METERIPFDWDLYQTGKYDLFFKPPQWVKGGTYKPVKQIAQFKMEWRVSYVVLTRTEMDMEVITEAKVEWLTMQLKP